MSNYLPVSEVSQPERPTQQQLQRSSPEHGLQQPLRSTSVASVGRGRGCLDAANLGPDDLREVDCFDS
jgi:hypothetical protein